MIHYLLLKKISAVEAERQEGIAEDFFNNGNLFYWTTLSIMVTMQLFKERALREEIGGGPPIWI